MGMGNIATTGMQAAMQDMDIISNNIANAGTYGFKKSGANFSDIYTPGNGANQIGLGVNLASISQDFTAIGATQTGIQSNLAINSNGFFVVTDQNTGATSYARNGQFVFDKSTGMFSYNNQILQGFISTDGSTIPSGGSPSNLVVNTSPVPAVATANLTLSNQNLLNLCSNDTVPAVSPFSPTNLNSYNTVSNSTVYDSLGNANQLSLYYVKTASNTWSVYAAITPPNSTTATVINQSTPGTLTFSATGALSSSSGLGSLSFSPATGATSPQTFAIDMTGATQFGTADNAGVFTGDGKSAGTYVNYAIDKDGIVNVSYSNGTTLKAGQVALANFSNPQGLEYLGNGMWSATSTSGLPTVNPENSASNITSGALEASNVDLAQELVKLINAQNTFQANAQVEQTYNQVMQTVTKL